MTTALRLRGYNDIRKQVRVGVEHTPGARIEWPTGIHQSNGRSRLGTQWSRRNQRDEAYLLMAV